MRRLLKTNAVRLAALYFALFATSVLTVLVFIYFSTADFAQRQTEATLDAESRGLAEQYAERGLAGLLETIQDRSAPGHPERTIYLITDPFLHPLAGNLSRWPRATQIRSGWIEFPVEEMVGGEKQSHTALASVFILPGGYRLLVGRDLRDASTFRARITRTLAWSGLLTLALGIAGGVFMTRHMLRRVEAVNRTSASIIHGDLSQRVPVSGSGDEFDQLAANLNAMLDQIERLMLGMRQVTDNIAHDLRTPLARLRARLEVTLLERPDMHRYGEALQDTITEADRLLGTFNALLSIAEAEAGSRRDSWSVVDLAEIARNVAELYEPLAEENGLELAVETDATLPVRGDRHLLSQALANLLDNALKYAPAGRIVLSAHERGEVARVEVADTGPGIPADRREAVFDRFVRLEGSRSSPGNGLGLSLVRAVAKLHAGACWLEDNAPGLKAVMTFPLAPAERGARLAENRFPATAV
ncbi:MAG TPA: HAMP domain-containing sensor histidine kinase [Stellaceae bacterium]|nr:HAMP domain-containing sensor histidine kinase [Stellaceae bacterium]